MLLEQGRKRPLVTPERKIEGREREREREREKKKERDREKLKSIHTSS